MNHSTINIFDELREEIRMIKFPAEPVPATMKRRTKKNSVTLVMPNGKRVKQFKKENEDLVAPLSLQLEGKSKKGDVYIRADGKRVRLVKKKDKKRKEKLIKKQEEQQQEQNEEAKRQLIECDWNEMSWEEAEAEQERIVRMSWQNEVVPSKKSAKDASSVVSDETCSTTEAETDSEEDMEQDDDSWDMESRDSSTSSSSADAPIDDDEEEMNAFLASLSESDDEEEQEQMEGAETKPEVRFSSVQRMSLKSHEVLARAEYMKRLSELANDLGNLKEERFRYVKMPRHHTQ